MYNRFFHFQTASYAFHAALSAITPRHGTPARGRRRENRSADRSQFRHRRGFGRQVGDGRREAAAGGAQCGQTGGSANPFDGGRRASRIFCRRPAQCGAMRSGCPLDGRKRRGGYSGVERRAFHPPRPVAVARPFSRRRTLYVAEFLRTRAADAGPAARTGAARRQHRCRIGGECPLSGRTRLGGLSGLENRPHAMVRQHRTRGGRTRRVGGGCTVAVGPHPHD